MKELVLSVIFIGNLQVTAYRSVPEQTDDSPYITSTGERVNPNGIAISQDLLKSGAVHYGDTVYIEDVGFKKINDCLNKRHKMHLDIWVSTKERESEVFKKFNKRTTRVWVIRKKE